MRDIARATDPVTSHLGAQEVTESGRRRSLKDKCFEVLGWAARTGDGLTYGQVAYAAGITPPQAWRRLSDLKNDGVIEQRGMRMWEGNQQGVWFVIEKPEQGTLL